jgi:hypothetical protein
MTLFSKGFNLKGVGALVASALVLLVSSCTEVNNSLGMDIVPPGQQFDVEFATIKNGIQSYLTLTDSIATSGLDYAYFGSMTDKHYGARTKASAMMQFAYALRTDTIAYADRDAKPDSLALLLGMKTAGGDTLKRQSFDVYRMRKALVKDSVYYNGIDYKEYIDSRPMFTCEFGGKPNGSTVFDTLSLKVADAALAEEFMMDLWNDTTLYTNDSLFVQKYCGLCLTPPGTSPEDAAIYGLNLQWSTEEGPMSYLVLYGHDYPKGDDPSLVEDEIMRAFALCNDGQYADMKAVSAVEHDYSATLFGGSINMNVAEQDPLANPVEVGYIDGLLGVTTTLEFDDEFVASLRALRPEGGEIFINKATLRIPLAEQDYTFFDYAPARIGTYTSYAKLTAVADYNYYYEANYDMELVYGGYLNRTFGCYELDLSLYLQQLLLDESKEVSRRITFGMPAYDYMDVAMVKLALGTEEALQFDITYTIIGK